MLVFSELGNESIVKLCSAQTSNSATQICTCHPLPIDGLRIAPPAWYVGIVVPKL